MSAPLQASPPPPPVDVDVAPLLPVGKTVRVVFDVTVNSPPVATYSNQGTVTGSNFSAVLTNTATTNGDRFNTSTTLISSLNPADQGIPVTFTATVTPTEGSGLTPDGTVQFKDNGSNVGSAVTCADAGGNTCSAQITTSSLASGTRSITADYLGGTHHDPSTSNTVSQVIVACTTNPVVTTNADGGAGSLRQALLDACTNNTITFNMGSVVSPIGLTSGELTATRNNLTVTGPGANLLTVQRTSGTSRIFHVTAGQTLTISGLTIAGGNATGVFPANAGGGLLNDHGTLTISNSTISGNTAGLGGGLYNNGDTTSASLTIVNTTVSTNSATVDGGGLYNKGIGGGTAMLGVTNSTISGNTANGSGGGLYNEGDTGTSAPLTVTNATITNNRADNDTNASGTGGGLTNVTATVTLRNTIVARNFVGGSGSIADDVVGALDTATSFNNLIGDGTNMTGVTQGSNGNQVGTSGSPIDPKLGALANNGGPTFTHALLIGSPALDAGDNTVVVAPPFLNTSPITDQRGTGFSRILDSADANTTQTVDIGAYETHPTIEDISDKTTNEDTPLSFTFNVGDATVGFDSITATSSNTTLVPNLVANINVPSGSGSTRTLNITPALDQSGTSTITVTLQKTIGGVLLTATDTFVLTVNAVNDAPTLNAIPDPPAILEDAGLQTVNLSGITAGGGESQTLVVTASSGNTALIPNPTVTYTSANATGSLTYTPVANASGSAVITVTVQDNGGTALGGIDTTTRTFTVVVNPVADTPSVPSPITTDEDVPATIVISRNPADGSEVTHFKITNISGGSLFQNDGTTPIVNNDFITFAQGNAGLKFAAPANTFGVAIGHVTVQASVSNGNAGLGGGTVTADITVNPVADTPTATNSTTTVNTQTTTGLVLDRNAVDGAEVTHFKITNITNGTLFQHDGTTPITNGQFITYAQGNAGLKFTPTPDSAATGSFQVQGAVDNVGTGLSTGSATATITLPCTTNPVVTTNADSGAGSLREALGLACAGSTITFSGVASPIGLTSAQLTIDKDVTINGPGADQLTVQRTSGTFRIMGILAGHTVTISGLTLANGLAAEGGAIENTHSALTIVNSVLSGHTATSGQGGAIFNDGNPASASLTLINTTVSGNQTSSFGGAIYNVGFNGGTAAVTITNSTVSGNTAVRGGGLFSEGNDAAHALVTVTNSTITGNRGTTAGGGLTSGQGTNTLRNTIVAGNVSGPSPSTTADDVSAVVDTPTSFNNLIGTDLGLSGVTNGVNGNQVGTVASPLDPRLGPLAANGGPTPTHALLAGSPALDAGDNTFVVAPPFVNTVPITDQRGTGFARIRDAADADTTATVDIGAFEASAAVEHITDKTTNEDTPLSFSFNVGDAASITTVTASSSNTTLVPNLPANLDVTGSGSTRTLNIVPALDQNGTATITVTVTSGSTSMSDTFVLTVIPVNDPPTLNPIADPPAILEDAGLQTVNLTGISTGASNEAQTLTVTASSNNLSLIPNPSVAYTSPNATGSLSYTPVANASGSAVITVTVDDGGTGTHTVVRTFTVTVTSVNDPPTLDAIPDPAAILEDAGLQTITLTGISAGGGESQTLVVTASSSNPALIPTPTVVYTSPAATGSLSYTPVANANGSAIITVTVDDGGTGTHTVTRTFTVTVTSVNDPPTLNAILDPPAILEDAGTQTVNLSGISAGGGESQTLVVTASSNNTALIPNPTVNYSSPATTGALTYTPVANANGSAIITVTVDDGGSGTHTVTRTFTVTVNPVADTPSITGATTQANAQTTSGLVVSRNVVDGAEVTHVKILGVSGGTLFQHDGTTPIAVGSFITIAQGAAGLRFTPTMDSVATGHVTIRASLSATDGGLGGGTATADITVTPIPTTLLLMTSLSPSTPGQAVTFTATLTPLAAAAGGSVQFKDGGVALGGPVALGGGGTATFTTSTLLPGLHHITVEFAGTPLYGASTGAVDQLVTSGRTITTGADSGGAPHVKRFGALDGSTPTGALTSFFAFDAGFTGGVRVAEADIDGDGVPDLITAPGPGAAPTVIVYNGATGGILRSFFAYDPAFTGGVFVATGDVDGDGRADIITGAGSGLPTVRVFSGASGALIRSFEAFTPAFTGGVRVAVGDVNGDGRADLIVGAGPGALAGPHVRVFSGATGTELPSVDPYPGFIGGVFVAAGDVNGDGFADVITGADAGGGAHVRAFDGRTGTPLASFFAFDASFTGGVRVAAGDVNGDGHADIITGAGPGGGSVVRVFDGATLALLTSFQAYAPSFAGGVFVATAAPNNRMVIDRPSSESIVLDHFQVAGWAIQDNAPVGSTGVDTVHVWAYPLGGSPIFLGAATMGDPRPDVAAIFGASYLNAGFHLDVSGLAEGVYDLVIYAHSSVSGLFNAQRIVRIGVHLPTFDVRLQVDQPQPNAGVPPAFRIAGWALETGGVAIDAIHVWAQGPGGLMFLGAASLGDPRPDVALAFGSQFLNSGYHLDVSGLADGQYLLLVFARAVGAPDWAPARVVPVTVMTPPPTVSAYVDVPVPGPSGHAFIVAGWALTQNVPAPPGITTIHVWAVPVGAGTPQFLGVPALGGARPDVAAIFGSAYLNSGFNLLVPDLPSGTWDIVVFIWPAGASSFTTARVVRITIP